MLGGLAVGGSLGRSTKALGGGEGRPGNRQPGCRLNSSKVQGNSLKRRIKEREHFRRDLVNIIL